MTSPVLSMNEVTTYRWTFEEDVCRYAAAGYEAIGVWRQKLADYGEEAGVDLLAESGLRVTNLMWAGGFTGSDGRSQQESINDAAHAIRLAGAMNAGCLVVYPGGRNNHIFRHAERLLCTAIEKLLGLAEAAEVTLAIEPMHPACATEWTFLTDLEATIALIDSFDTPALKLVFDAYHFGHDPSVISNLGEIVPYTALVQLGDRQKAHGIDHDRCLLGKGLVPLPEILHNLLEAGYSGDFDIELAGEDIELSDYEQLLSCSKQAFDRLLEPTHRTRQF
ncbi:MAG: sugar phosphate isomerase/epimerase [Planctomycetales bacterium]|nr:sugar phosphate isomerase/epimerase [Planctomycetales bacterium]